MPSRSVMVRLSVPAAMLFAAAACGASSGSPGGPGGGSSGGSQVPIKISQFATQAQVVAAVKAAETTDKPPSGVVPSLTTLSKGPNLGDTLSGNCGQPAQLASSFSTAAELTACESLGDANSSNVLVLTGDSRAQMWIDAIDRIAIASHLRLVLLARAGCPSAIADFRLINNGTVSNAPWPACSAWHKFVLSTIRSLHPVGVIISSADTLSVENQDASDPAVVTADFEAFLNQLPKSAKVAVIGGFPQPGDTQSPTLCLSKTTSLVKCAYQPVSLVTQSNAALKAAAAHAGATYIDQTPWLCATSCPAVIGHFIPYTIDGYHVDADYAAYLTGVLWAGLKPVLG